MNNEEKLTAVHEETEYKIQEIIGDLRIKLSAHIREPEYRTVNRYIEQAINKIEALKKTLERFNDYFSQEAKIEDTILQLKFENEEKDNA